MDMKFSAMSTSTASEDDFFTTLVMSRKAILWIWLSEFVHIPTVTRSHHTWNPEVIKSLMICQVHKFWLKSISGALSFWYPGAHTQIKWHYSNSFGHWKIIGFVRKLILFGSNIWETVDEPLLFQKFVFFLIPIIETLHGSEDDEEHLPHMIIELGILVSTSRPYMIEKIFFCQFCQGYLHPCLS